MPSSLPQLPHNVLAPLQWQSATWEDYLTYRDRPTSFLTLIQCQTTQTPIIENSFKWKPTLIQCGVTSGFEPWWKSQVRIDLKTGSAKS